VPFIDHVGLCPADMEAALHFYRDGIGLDVLFDVSFEANFEPLLGVPTKRPRTVFLGDRTREDAGRVELLDLGNGAGEGSVEGSREGSGGGDAALPDGRTAPGLPHRGACLLSFHVPVEETLRRLADLGLGGPPRRLPTPGGPAAVVVDPDGVMVELVSRAVAY
jgi:catechol 2,3-dioxygenase-like lactoylglutathione lyase family enzyme